MQRYFGSLDNNNIILNQDDIFHISRVIRNKVGDLIEVVIEEIVYIGKITSFTPFTCMVLEKTNKNNELDANIVLCCALLKGEKMDFVIQKATELGVNEIILVQTERCIAKIKSSDKDNKIKRFNKIAKEASEQSKRNKIPLIYQIIPFNDITRLHADIKLIAYESAISETSSFINEIKNIKKNQKCIVLIGPEGGFSSKEVDYATGVGFHIVSLGKRILRAETASLYSLSVIANILEQ